MSPSIRREPVRTEIINPPTPESLAEARALLSTLGTEIENAEREQAQIEGALEQQVRQFQTEFGLDDIKAVRKRIIQLRRDKTVKEAKLVQRVENLRRDYQW